MTGTALAATTEQQPAAAEALKPDKPRPIGRKIKAAIDLKCSGQVKTWKEAAQRVNCAPEYLSRALSKDHVTAYLRRKACHALAMAAGRAAAVKVELLDSASEHVRNDASSFVLGLANIKPASDAQVSVNIELKAGYVIDLRDDGELGSSRPLMAHQRQIEAKPLESQDVGQPVGPITRGTERE